MIFFGLFYPVYLLVRRTRAGHVWLLVASYVFYGSFHILYPALILYATIVDYAAVLGMAKTRKKKTWLWVSVTNNLGLLGFFKYGGFATDNLNALLSTLGASFSIPEPGVLLPLGLSFYVFRSLTYTIDFYRAKIDRERSFVRHALFVSFFPVLLAGPIERASSFFPQLREAKNLTGRDVSDGISLFIVGLFKKVALADYLALYVDQVYEAPSQFTAPALLLATFAFAWQIYFDFSGYTDMARGIARMMGFRLMLNFNNPYLADGLRDFWRRWHISLSTWFKDYVYIPLGGNRKGSFRTYMNLFIAMVVSGLWHGAAWTFVAWGALHGAGMMLMRSLERSTFYKDRVPRIAKQIFVFGFVSAAWIFFRAATFQDACLIVRRIFTSGISDPRCPVLFLLMICGVWLYQFAYESRVKHVLQRTPVKTGLVVVMLLYLVLCCSSGGQEFIYNQF